MMIIWNTPTGIAVTRIAEGDPEVVAVEMQQHLVGWEILHIGDLAMPEDAESFDEVSFNPDVKVLETDIVKVRETTKKRLRRERTPLLAALDVQYMRAQEQGASTTEIVAEKQRLRDITNMVDTLNTVAELRAITCQR